MPGEAEYRQIERGMQTLDVSITMDRQEYLQGEQIWATVTVANPTSAPIAAFTPFHSAFTSLALFELNKDGEWQGAGSSEGAIQSSITNMMDWRKVIAIAPGERLTQKLDMTKLSDWGDTIRHTPLEVMPPGQYRLMFVYERLATVEFRVVKVEGESAAVGTPLPEADQFFNPRASRQKGCMGMWAAALRTSERTIVVASVDGTATVCGKKESGLQLLRSLFPFTRVAEAPDGVRALALQPLGDGTVNMAWEDARGNPQLPHLLPRRHFPDAAQAR
jgi:hypothetical protein